MNTACFIDGYNLYYGLLAGSAYKWLDLPALVGEIVRVQQPSSVIVGITYFSAPVKAEIATRGVAPLHNQTTYLRALRAHGVGVELGRHQLQPARAPRFVRGRAASRSDQVDIWKLEEKETDVNIAIAMYRAAAKNQVEQIVLLSADTDLAPALKAIREDFPDVVIGTVFPHKPMGGRPPPGSLTKHSHWTRHHIRDDELAANQFGKMVATRKKPAIKPEAW